ncbi:MAG: hypothetical protein LPK80_09780 [Bacteroidota bacterium]|nr:hypothetical protein [Bacteroidota bacterium]
MTLLLLFISGYPAVGQTEDPKKVVSSKTTQTTGEATDTNRVVEDAPLDIAQNRGLFILTHDKKMQLRILGSVRYLVVYDDQPMPSKNGYRTTELDRESKGLSPSYYNGLNQTRLGFEITRQISKGQEVFVRLETDFAGPNGYRIRHAYGQYSKFLFGQTWSLFSQVRALPATVDFNNPSGSITVRSPQIRFTPSEKLYGMNVAMSLEYLIPDVVIPDSFNVETSKIFPDIAFRMDRTTSWGYFQISGVVPLLSAKGGDNYLVIKPGWGVATSAVIDSWKGGTWYLQLSGGMAISRFLNDLSGNGFDVLFGPGYQVVTPFAYGGEVTYEHRWKPSLFSSLSFSATGLEVIDFLQPSDFLYGYTIRTNTFCDIVDGARIGSELIYGVRRDHDLTATDGLRLNLLVYYDF